MSFKIIVLIAFVCVSLVSSAPYGMDFGTTEPSVMVERIEESTQANSYESTTVTEAPVIEIVEQPKVKVSPTVQSYYSSSEVSVVEPRVELVEATTVHSYASVTEMRPVPQLELTTSEMDVSTMGYKKKRSGYGAEQVVEATTQLVLPQFELSTAGYGSSSSEMSVVVKQEFTTVPSYESSTLPSVKLELTTASYSYSSSNVVPRVELEVTTVGYSSSTEVVAPQLEVEVSTVGYKRSVETRQ